MKLFHRSWISSATNYFTCGTICEYQDSRLDGCSLSGLPPKVSAKQKRRPKERVYRTPLHKPVEFVDAFPQPLRSYIHHVKDVAADGHCGYRAIAALLRYGEDGWVQARRDLLNELESYSVHYSALYGSENRVYELKHSLAYFGPDANFDRWMTMPDMGHIIASCYDVVLVHLSNVQCLMFLLLDQDHCHYQIVERSLSDSSIVILCRGVKIVRVTGVL
ncbi:PREDICTED: PKS-NRPS hybrid synthetase [Prunus dulcis]|uniref:PREDICTED: PKS-NRPS hybrid synthetase n=1 Tax=Prunus dulcis TaxID=3755 RepID=A0A5E4GAS8_PRUDU|nr:PREDICTED: PKS-NRPS hybrid synthetase [Prunus dulcis]